MSRYTAQELANKIDYEGGLWDALEYGITPDMVPVEIETAWAKMLTNFRAADAVWERDISPWMPMSEDE